MFIAGCPLNDVMCAVTSGVPFLYYILCRIKQVSRANVWDNSLVSLIGSIANPTPVFDSSFMTYMKQNADQLW